MDHLEPVLGPSLKTTVLLRSSQCLSYVLIICSCLFCCYQIHPHRSQLSFYQSSVNEYVAYETLVVSKELLPCYLIISSCNV